mgnify:CR=1 FL=1
MFIEWWSKVKEFVMRKIFLKKTFKNIWSLEIKFFIFAAPKRRTNEGLTGGEIKKKFFENIDAIPKKKQG